MITHSYHFEAPISHSAERVDAWLHSPYAKKRYFSLFKKFPSFTVIALGDDHCTVRMEQEFRAFFPQWKRKKVEKSLSWAMKLLTQDLIVSQKYPNKPLRILVSGSTGLVGKAFVSFQRLCGHEVVALRRKKGEEGIYWDPTRGEFKTEDFENFDCVVHLAGKNIASGLWTKKRKEEIFLSRARDSWLLGQALLRTSAPPSTLICASAIGYYGSQGDQKLTEDASPGKGFLAEVCKGWEKATQAVEESGVRGVHTRFGIILSEKGGMLAKMLPLFHFGLGAVWGSGQQKISWIALDDVVYGLTHCMHKKELSGGINFCAPNTETAQSFAKAVANAVHRPLFLRIGERPLKFFLGEMAEEMLLASTSAYPQKLLDTGFSFHYPEISLFMQRLS